MTTFIKPFLYGLCIALLSGHLLSSQAETTAKPHPLHVEGIENFFKLSDNLFSGSSPEGETFAKLKNLGIKTIISVDGAKPDVETAEKVGLRYVHLPFGYSGVPTNRALALIKAARELPGPIYVHCHHGMHRGPAAAAVICRGNKNWSTSQAVEWLKQAGTATNYSGLYESVENFQVPSDAELKKVAADFPAAMEVSSLVDTMVEIDHRFDNLKRLRKTSFQPSSTHPDINPKHEALLLEELFKEWNRSPESKRRAWDFQDAMVAAEKLAGEFRIALESEPQQANKANNARLSAAFEAVTKSCTACHKAHRNQ